MTNPSQSNSREYQRQAIDTDIKSLEESIRTLRLCRNVLVPISSLPPEVFVIIFSFLHARVISEAFVPCKKIDQLDSLALFRASHVCHYWREIALNHPLFWTHIDFTASPQLVRLRYFFGRRKHHYILKQRFLCQWTAGTMLGLVLSKRNSTASRASCHQYTGRTLSTYQDTRKTHFTRNHSRMPIPVV